MVLDGFNAAEPTGHAGSAGTTSRNAELKDHDAVVRASRAVDR
jgi:hypothetical protein